MGSRNYGPYASPKLRSTITTIERPTSQELFADSLDRYFSFMSPYNFAFLFTANYYALETSHATRCRILD